MPAVPRMIFLKDVDSEIDDNISQVTDDIHFRKNPPTDSSDKSVFSTSKELDRPSLDNKWLFAHVPLWTKKRGRLSPVSPPRSPECLPLDRRVRREALHAVNANIDQTIRVRRRTQHNSKIFKLHTHNRNDGRGYVI